MKNQRKSERFNDFAGISCPELCVVSGVLTDISRVGFKAEFNAPCEIDAEKEYTVHIRLSRKNSELLELTVQPAWSNFLDGKTFIGFSILPSKDSSRFEDYVDLLEDDISSANDDGIIPNDNSSLFI